jgi:iron-sulfur cluster repair protein YtfE (RIC family)
VLKYGQITLTGIIDKMRELTHGFTAPPEACKCYGELLDVLAAIQMEVAAEVRIESSMLFPQAMELVELARHCEASERKHAGAPRH